MKRIRDTRKGRRNMARLIDADALKAKLQEDHDFLVEAWGGFPNMPREDKVRADELTMCIARVVNAPTIDAVSVVRCKECKHKYQEPWNNGVAVEGECEIWHSATLDNDFCSYGERKTND